MDSSDTPLHLVPGSRSWPRRLDELAHPPTELWARGAVELLVPPAIGIVGSRSPSPYGEAQARRFAAALASHGFVIVSGLARGIDACAHQGALDADGGTIAVLGSGVDRPWPRGAIADRVAREGLLLSEYEPGRSPRRHHFPLRNRLIAGLAVAVLVVEAAYGSGSLITARWAVDEGRTVFALPGRVDHPMARGCHRLLREGALLVESPAEVLAELGLATSQPLPLSAPGTTGREPELLATLTGETSTTEEIARRLERELSEVLVELVERELAGEVVRCPGGLWRRRSHP